ncbi:hypothetical protein NDU88_008907 [Pleurodeles waltl]|uniref:Uncharacterized protein n=1 Tax=Pleurodeles waltl TaxID=8319 RepID=A0AAV7RZI4_PLEWA|nr:hypothetical protein NDU88_008907 [Pleurodeles waltl]
MESRRRVERARAWYLRPRNKEAARWAWGTAPEALSGAIGGPITPVGGAEVASGWTRGDLPPLKSQLGREERGPPGPESDDGGRGSQPWRQNGPNIEGHQGRTEA